MTTMAGPSRADETPARSLLHEGLALRRAHRNEEALAAFEAASRAEPSACATAQIGLAEQALGRWVAAEHDVMAALAQTDDPWVRRNRDALEEARAAIAGQLGWLEVVADASDAEMVVDGRTVRLADGPVRVAAGELSLRVRATGRQAVERTVTILPATRTRLEIALPLEIEEVREVAPQTPPPPVALPVRAPPLPEARGSLVGPLVVGGIGIGALGTGVWLGGSALRAKHTRDAHCTDRYCDPVGLSADHDARVDAGVSTAAFAVGAAAISVGALWLVFQSRARVHVTPTVGRVTGVMIEGSL